jgi:MFS family permease
MICLFVGALDQTVVSTATPKILGDLGGFALLSWLFTSYMLASTVIIPLVGKLGDIYGRKLFLIAGVATFMLASAACGAAQNMPTLIWMRAVQPQSTRRRGLHVSQLNVQRAIGHCHFTQR